MEAHQRRAERLMLQQLYEVDSMREHPYQPTVSANSRQLAKATRARAQSAPPARQV